MPTNKTVEWLKGRTIEEMQAIEAGGRILFPDTVKRARKDGTFDEILICVRVPRPSEKQQARADAVRIFKKQGLDRAQDEDLFEELDTLAILARAMRDRAPPHDQFQPVEFLLSGDEKNGFDLGSLYEVWERLKVYQSMIDPRLDVVTEDDVVAAVLAIDMVQNLSPLVVMAGGAMDTFVVRMASLTASLLTGNGSSKPTVTSTPVC